MDKQIIRKCLINYFFMNGTEQIFIRKFQKAFTPMRIHSIVLTYLAEDSVVIACKMICKYFFQ